MRTVSAARRPRSLGLALVPAALAALALLATGCPRPSPPPGSSPVGGGRAGAYGISGSRISGSPTPGAADWTPGETGSRTALPGTLVIDRGDPPGTFIVDAVELDLETRLLKIVGPLWKGELARERTGPDDVAGPVARVVALLPEDLEVETFVDLVGERVPLVGLQVGLTPADGPVTGALFVEGLTLGDDGEEEDEQRVAVRGSLHLTLIGAGEVVDARFRGPAVVADGPAGSLPYRILAWIVLFLFDQARQQPFVFIAAVVGFIRLWGTTVQTGWRGVLFRFGRVRADPLEPGFHWLIPGFDMVRKTRVRSITLDVRRQRVTTRDGLVYDVDVNIVFRVSEPVQAMVEIDDVRAGVTVVLAMVTQDVLRAQTRATVLERESLGEDLRELTQEKLRRWGVTVERAGFTSIAPTVRTLRLTQLGQLARERRDARVRFRRGRLVPVLATALVGGDRNLRPRAWPRYRTRRAILREARLAPSEIEAVMLERTLLGEDPSIVEKELRGPGPRARRVDSRGRGQL